MLKKCLVRLVQTRCLCRKKGTDHQQHYEELFQCYDLDDMQIEKHCKDCLSLCAILFNWVICGDITNSNNDDLCVSSVFCSLIMRHDCS